ncbi:MAG: hypothetical protein IJ560_01680 [Alphaproteobacteria bacterium]|nr:hypothetical protein [Alphaproteobacteria bacterium]
MLTKIDICSMALLKLGERPINALTDDTAAANLSRTLFGPIMDGLIASHPWRFACRQIDLVRNDGGYFVLPNNVLRVVRCRGRVVGNRIYAPGKTNRILAITRTPVECFPGYFVDLAATKLALEFCIPLTGDQNVFRMLATLYESELKTARFIDSTTTPCEEIDSFSLVNIRF